MLDGEFDQRRISYLGFVLNRRFLLLLIGLLQVSVSLQQEWHSQSLLHRPTMSTAGSALQAES